MKSPRQYVVTARAKGLSERRVLYGHVFRNAMLLVISGIPQAFISVFFAGSLLIEVIFSLDGLGRMSYEAAVSRDYPVVFGSLFIFTPVRPPDKTHRRPLLHPGGPAYRLRREERLMLNLSPVARRRFERFKKNRPWLVVAVACLSACSY